MQFDKGQLQARNVEQYSPRRRDDLPYAIDFSGAIDDLPPPPPGVPRSAGARQAWALAYARDHTGRQVVATTDGWFVGFDAGEYGGSLWWYPSSPGPGVKLSDRNVRAIIGEAGGQSFLVLIGLRHKGTRNGAVLTLSQGARADWKIVKQADLRGAPQVYASSPAGLVIVTDASVERLTASGALEVLSDAEYGPMTPYSIALGADGEIAVGLRFFVHLLAPGQPQYRHHWLVPPQCARFDDQPLGCVCTGRLAP